MVLSQPANAEPPSVPVCGRGPPRRRRARHHLTGGEELVVEGRRVSGGETCRRSAFPAWKQARRHASLNMPPAAMRRENRPVYCKQMRLWKKVRRDRGERFLRAGTTELLSDFI